LVSTPRAVVTPFISSVVLGVGVALLLEAALGSDGYSTLINGLSIATGVPFVVVNCVVGVLLVAMAWARGLRPGLGTLVQPVVVGFTVSAAMNVIHRPDHLALRGLLLLLAFPVLTVGVAGYLGSGTGARPTEAAALAWEPPVPFRWSYSAAQGGGALVGWLLGGAIGPGTVLVVLLLGPAVDLLSRRFMSFETSPEPLARQVVWRRCGRGSGRAGRGAVARARPRLPAMDSSVDGGCGGFQAGEATVMMLDRHAVPSQSSQVMTTSRPGPD